MRRLHTFALVPCFCLLALALWSERARAAPLLTGFGGPLGFGTHAPLPANDDDSSDDISLLAAFPDGLQFFGGPYDTMWVNTNGNITFGGPLRQYTPDEFPVADEPMIAPYWADVDTRGPTRPPRGNAIYWHLEPGRIVVTWHNVGYYSAHDDKIMDFQLILTNALGCGAGDFDVEFRYNSCEWTTGDASGGRGGLGGTPAQAGFDSGNGEDFVEIHGSRTASILSLCTTSNVGEPGVWRFTVRNGAVVCPGNGTICDTGLAGACGTGITQCVGRETACMPVATREPERCDAIDNDCDRMVDEVEEGETPLCPRYQACVNGTCLPSCFEGGCTVGQTCNADGICVEDACATVECEEGLRCVGGTCIDSCNGVTCPHAQQCVGGRCMDLCDVLTCSEEQVCVDGLCVGTCPCNACPENSICGADGACTPLGCDLVTCERGSYCEGGVCKDACEGAVCPAGETCRLGDCVPLLREPDAGTGAPQDGLNAHDSGFVFADAGTGEPDRRGSRRGCSCSVPTRSSEGDALAFAGLALLGVIVARRKWTSNR